MIFVTLGTQDKQFKRLLDAVEVIDVPEKIIAQVGSTDFYSEKIEIHKYLDNETFDKYMKEANVIITHAGVGTIIQGLKLGKKMIVAARLKEYNEHVNDHQLQILESFSNEGYILPLENFDDLEILIKKNFTPKEFKSNQINFATKLEHEINKLTKKRR